MSVQVITNGRLWVDGFDLSGRTSKLGLSYGAKAEPATAMLSDTENYLPGEKVFKASHEVIFEAGAGLSDEVLFTRIAVGSVLMSVAPTGIEGEAGFFGKVMGAGYKPGFTVGALPRASFDAEASDRLIRGTVMAQRTMTGNGATPSFQVGPVATTPAQHLYAVLHVLAASGTGPPTLTVRLKSAPDNLGGITEVYVFPDMHAVGAAYMPPVAGLISDTWWSLTVGVTGGSPSFTFVVVIGIQ